MGWEGRMACSMPCIDEGGTDGGFACALSCVESCVKTIQGLVHCSVSKSLYLATRRSYCPTAFSCYLYQRKKIVYKTPMRWRQ